jgi:hypothetical protein
MLYAIVGIVGSLIGLIAGVLRTEQQIRKHTRRWVKASGHCYMCEDCPDGCPLQYPNDSRNV